MSDTPPPSPDRVHRILADAERRRLVRVLADVDRCLPVAAVVQRLADRTGGVGRGPSRRLDDDGEADGAGRPDSGPSNRELRIRLHHDHLPRLAAADLVEFSAETRVVRPTEALRAVAERLVLPEAETETEAVLDGAEGR